MLQEFIKSLIDGHFIGRKMKLHIPPNFINEAYLIAKEDIRYYYPDMDKNQILYRIIVSGPQTVLFLFRLGNILVYQNKDEYIVIRRIIYNIMKNNYQCDIRLDNSIDKGLYIGHNSSVVIGGPIKKIGKGFMIHQNCTIGQIDAFSSYKLPIIGDRVVCYSGSSIFGNITIGDNVVIAANSLVLNDVPSNSLVAGSPAKIKKFIDYKKPEIKSSFTMTEMEIQLLNNF